MKTTSAALSFGMGASTLEIMLMDQMLQVAGTSVIFDLAGFSLKRQAALVTPTNRWQLAMIVQRVGLVGLLALLPAVLAADVPWYHNAVIYQVYPRSFMDSDGDGIGDLNGFLDRIDYFHRLGIDAVWFSPFYTSPNVDFGYDVSDYRDINPEYGTLKDFDNIVKKLTNKGIKVILDFVPNHSSTEHIWFKYSENRNDTDEVEYSKFYVWRDPKGIDHDGKPKPPNNWVRFLDRIDYFHRLGIDAVWFSPFYTSPNVDFGYDVSDYRDINPEYGTLKDFDNIVKKLTNKGIKVILDFVPNHSSTEHIWFKYSENRNDTDEVEYSKFYVWRDPKGIDHDGKPKPPNNWLSVMNSGTSWMWSEKRKQFYFHNFLDQQAEFNFEYPAVKKNMIDILKFWMARGVAGFRVDAVSWLYEDQNFPDEPKSVDYDPDRPNVYDGLVHMYTNDLPKTYEIVQQWREAMDKFSDYMEQEDKILIVESYSTLEMLLKYYGTPGRPGATFPFNFVLLMILNENTPASRWAEEINGYYKAIGDNWANWVLGNHDRRRVADRFSPEWVDLLHMLSMTLKGTAVTYYGEEIGLNGNSLRWDQNKDVQGRIAGEEGFLTRSRDFERGPMPWTNGSMAGFTNFSSTWVPLAPSYWDLNVEAQETAERSHLKVYKQLVRLRKSRTLTYGDCYVTSNEEQLLFVVRSVSENPTVITVVNMGADVVETNLHNVRSGLPRSVHLQVSSTNYPEDKKTLQTNKITLQPKTGIVVSTEII